MADEDQNLGAMDGMTQEAPPAQEQQPERQPEQQQPRDEAGKFAPRGGPSEEHASRRYATERDEWKRRHEETEARYNALNKRLEDMAALAKGDDPDAPPADPMAPVLKKMDAIDQRLTQRDQQEQEARTQQAIRAYADEDEARFRQQQPDFPNAVQHYVQSRMTEMKAFGVPEEQAGQALAQEAQALLLQAAQAQRSPSEIIYAMAQARGYQPQQGQAPQQPSNVVEMQRQPAGGRSFGNGAGAPGGGMTPQQIANMSEEDYMALRATPDGMRMIKRAMGG